MSVDFVVNATERSDTGKGASRRLRRQGLVPAIVYGGRKDPEPITVVQNEVVHQLENEGFYSHVLTVKVGDRSERAILRDLQRHPFKPLVLHMDFQRVSEDQAIRVNVPLHFLNEDKCKGVREDGGIISRLITEVEVSCLPRHLPEYLELDIGELRIGETLHLSALQLPEGVDLTQTLDEEHDPAVVNVHHRVSEVEPEVEGEEEGDVDVDRDRERDEDRDTE